jgi:hypothetical protein
LAKANNAKIPVVTGTIGFICQFSLLLETSFAEAFLLQSYWHENNIENKTSKIEWDGNVGICSALCSFSRLVVVQCIITTLLEAAHQLLDPYP